MFAKRVLLADFREGRSAVPFQVLCDQADAGEGKYLVAPAQAGMSLHDHVRMQSATFTERDVLADDAIGADLTPRADPRFSINDRGMMNEGHVEQPYPSARMKVTSASLTPSPST